MTAMVVLGALVVVVEAVALYRRRRRRPRKYANIWGDGRYGR